jgi:hypothetical protein
MFLFVKICGEHLNCFDTNHKKFAFRPEASDDLTSQRHSESGMKIMNDEL